MGSVDFGAAVIMQNGSPLAMTVQIDVVLAPDAPSPLIVYRPTGQPLPGISTVFDTDPDTYTHVMPLPLCDCPDMGYGDGSTIILTPEDPYTHFYQATINYLTPDFLNTYDQLKQVKTFVISSTAPTGDIDDLALYPPDPPSHMGMSLDYIRSLS